MKSQIFQITNNGITINWKYLLIAIVVLFGGGGSWIGISLATVNQVDEKIELQAEKQKSCDKDQDLKIEKNNIEIKEVKKISGIVKIKIDAVQEVQQRQIARNESRRLTEKIANRTRREREYDRLYDLNMKRLKKGSDPCASIDCN